MEESNLMKRFFNILLTMLTIFIGINLVDNVKVSADGRTDFINELTPAVKEASKKMGYMVQS